MKKHAVYHISIKGKRSTISIDIVLDDLLAIKMARYPRSKEHHQEQREIIQRWIDSDPGKYETNPSQEIRRKLMELLAGADVSERYWDWRIKHQW